MKKGYISKADLAVAYRPDASISTAIKSLYRHLEETPGLMTALKAIGYNPRQKYFSPKQIEVIYSKIGAP